MPDHDLRSLIPWAVGAVVLVVLGLWYAGHLHRGGGGAVAQAAARAPVIGLSTASGGRVVVDVSGAVRHPGVYRLPASARVNDALKRAGGATRRADLTQINRAARLEDGRQVLVPVRTPAGAAAGPVAPGAGTPGPPLNLNTATLEQLDALDGIGPAMAQRILDYRKAHGGFGSVEELGQVPGIGDKRLAALRDKVRV